LERLQLEVADVALWRGDAHRRSEPVHPPRSSDGSARR
jgi:hypothetical protein